MLRRLEMMVLVITEGSGAAESGHLLIEGDFLLTAFKNEGERRVKSLMVGDEVDCADLVPSIRSKIAVLKIT